MLKRLKNVVMLAALLAPGLAFAHQGEDHGAGKAESLKGTVESFADSKLTVKAADGKIVNVHVDDRTVYENAGVLGKSEDLNVGAKVVVQGEPMNDGTLHATKVRFGKTGSKK